MFRFVTINSQCNVDVYFPNNPQVPPLLDCTYINARSSRSYPRKHCKHIYLVCIILLGASGASGASGCGPLTHFRGKRKFELCRASQYLRGKTFREIQRIVEDRIAKCDIPSCLPSEESTKECKLLIECIFKHDDCSNNAYHNRCIRYAHVSKHVEDPNVPQTDIEVCELWKSKFNPSHLTFNDNYYYNQFYSDKFVPILKATYTEAKNTGVVAFNHWIVSQEHLKYSIFEYDFASDCPDGRNSGYFLRKKYPWLHTLQELQYFVPFSGDISTLFKVFTIGVNGNVVFKVSHLCGFTH